MALDAKGKVFWIGGYVGVIPNEVKLCVRGELFRWVSCFAFWLSFVCTVPMVKLNSRNFLCKPPYRPSQP